MKKTFCLLALMLPIGARAQTLGMAVPPVVPGVAILCPASATTGASVAPCNFGGGGGGGNAAAGATGTTIPSFADFLGFSSGGNLVGVSSSNPLPVTGTFYQTTQPVSAASLPLPAGAATASLQPALNGDGGALTHVTNFPATQPVSGSVSVSALPALPAGTNAIGSVSNLSPQQTMQTETPVTVPAATSTLVWTASTSARTLKIIPEAVNTSCRLSDTGGAATSSNGFVIPGGYVWNLIEPPPSTNVYAYCTSAAIIDVSQGN